MSKLKRLANDEDNLVIIENPISEEEIQNRNNDYPLLSSSRFAKKYSSLLFKPINITYKNKTYEIQYNTCSNPFCDNYGKNQFQYDKIPNKPNRYKLSGGGISDKVINCNNIPESNKNKTLDYYTTVYSNWSIAEEIKRLITINSVVDYNLEYKFHKDNCINSEYTHINNKSMFRYKGESSSKSEKWQCKSCGKITNILPSKSENFQYHQKKNDILPRFAELLLNKTPVKRTCEILNITATTYYNKLEWLYKRCLEFLNTHESKKFEKIKFNRIWLNTDMMIYNLNNVRKHGKGGRNYQNTESLQLPTYIAVSGDFESKYIFRADVAYDWSITQDKITEDTLLFKEDHVYSFSRKNARYRIQYCPQPPTVNDEQTVEEYQNLLNSFDIRKNYIDGLHVMTGYTLFAHYWLIEKSLNVDKWRFVSDEDSVILTTLFRVFSDKILLNDAQHFLCKVDRKKPMKQAFGEWVDSKDFLERPLVTAEAKGRVIYIQILIPNMLSML